MPINRSRPKETREMRLLSTVIQQDNVIKGEFETPTGDESLPQFIARRRNPGDDWRAWAEVSHELASVTGEIVNDATLRRWARWYGIPEYTQADGEGKTDATAYREALEKAGITL